MTAVGQVKRAVSAAIKAAGIDQFLRITVGTDAQCVQLVEALQEILG